MIIKSHRYDNGGFFATPNRNLNLGFAPLPCSPASLRRKTREKRRFSSFDSA